MEFKRFFDGLSNNAEQIHIFQGRHGFSCHGNHSRYFALLCHNSLDAICCQYGLDTLYVTKEALRRTIPKFFLLNLSIYLWSYDGDSWHKVCTASRTNYANLLTQIRCDNTTFLDDVGGQVASIVFDKATNIFGLAVVDVFQKRIRKKKYARSCVVLVVPNEE